MNEPGLVKREIHGTTAGHLLIRETWDLTVPGCPIVAHDGAISYERTFYLSKDEMEERVAHERSARVQARYDELMREGKHGHYETMFRVVREEIERTDKR